MPKPRRKLPKGIHVHESGSVYICYKNEHGRIIRENTHQTDVNAAELMLAQARTDVAMKRRFTSLTFESVKFIDLFNDWWKNHGSRTRSKFEYRTPRVLARFDKKRAREITPDAVRGFLADLRTTGMRKGEILSRRWSDIDLDSGNPCVYVRQTKNDEPKRIQLPDRSEERRVGK